MIAPGTTTKDIDSSVPTTPSVDVSTGFVAGQAERGPVGVAVPCLSQADTEATFGLKVSYGYIWVAGKWIPIEEGATTYFSRVVGPAAKQAAAKLVDGTTANTLEVLAANPRGDVDPGAWGNAVKVKITLAEAKVKVEVFLGEALVEETLQPLTKAEAILWAKSSAYIRLKDLGAGDPKTQEVTLTGGTDDRASITITQWEAATAAFTKDLGPGQIAWPGQTTKAARVALMTHAKATNRIVVPDAVDTRTKATHLAAAEEWSTADATLRQCSFRPFGPWTPVPSAEGVLEAIPPSILVMAAIARHDAETYQPARGVNNPNSPAAGVNGILRSAVGLSQEAWTDTERGELSSAINVIRVVYGQVRIYDYGTMANPLTDPLHKRAQNRRLDMAIKAKGQVEAEAIVLGQVDGKGLKLGDLASALRGVCQPYAEVGALFAEGEDPGFEVDVSEDINPPKQLFEENKVRAIVRTRRSPDARFVELDYLVEGVS